MPSETKSARSKSLDCAEEQYRVDPMMAGQSRICMVPKIACYGKGWRLGDMEMGLCKAVLRMEGLFVPEEGLYRWSRFRSRILGVASHDI